jgi:hypothetical protein
VQSSGVGVCNGMVGNDLPSPHDVVQLYRSVGITKMRIYAPNSAVMEALRDSGIGLVLGVANEDIPDLAATQASAASWVQTNVRPYHPNVNMMYVAVGNEVQGDIVGCLVPAMHTIESALAAVGLASVIKVTTCVRLDVVTNTYPPSMGGFAKPYMGGVAQFLAATGAPLMANVYPYFAYQGNPRDISLGYATFQGGHDGARQR